MLTKLMLMAALLVFAAPSATMEAAAVLLELTRFADLMAA